MIVISRSSKIYKTNSQMIISCMNSKEMSKSNPARRKLRGKIRT